MTTVTCVWVQGEYPYTVLYVERLRAMVERWIDRPFRFVCLTDRPWDMPAGVESIPVQKMPGFAPWTKLELFNPVRQWSGRMLYLDLDTLIVSSLQPILDIEAPFAITADPKNKKNRSYDSFGRAIVRRFNSSVMVWDGGTFTDLYTDWTEKDGARLSGDQDWIGERRPGAVMMPREWFPRISEITDSGDMVVPVEANVVLVKVPKCVDAAGRWPAFREAWA
jgi:hypothetical protein